MKTHLGSFCGWSFYTQQYEVQGLEIRDQGLEILFWIISSLNYREVEIKNITSKNNYYDFFLSIKHMFWACERNVSERRFFYTPKTYVIMDSY